MFGNKKKKPVKIAELDAFLSKQSFTNKEEQAIWNKFSCFVGSGDYHIDKHGNRATIHSRGQKYFYLVKQVNDSNNSIAYYKIDNQEEYYKPENQWDHKLFFDSKNGIWREPEPAKPMSPEDEAISIIEAVLVSSWKFYKKNLDFDSNKIKFFFKKEDFCYTYYGGDKNWHSFCPSNEKLVSYAERFENTEFLELLNSDEYKWHREYYNI